MCLYKFHKARRLNFFNINVDTSKLETKDDAFFSDHTFGIPIPCCPGDKLDESSTIERCSESGKHDYRHPMPQYILHSSLRPD